MKKAAFFTLLACVAAAPILLSRTVPQANPERLALEDAIRLLRVINTAEATAFVKTQSYQPLEKLVTDGYMSRIGGGFRDSSSATVKDHRLLLITSADGKHYSVSLVPESGCDTAAFSQDPGIIYTAKPLGCSDTSLAVPRL